MEIYIQSIIFSYFDTRVIKINNQRFLSFAIFFPYFCSYLSLLTFSYILFHFSYSDVAICEDVMKLKFNLFLLGEYVKTLVYYFISIMLPYQKIIPIFIYCTVMFFNNICLLILHHFEFLSFSFHIQ